MMDMETGSFEAYPGVLQDRKVDKSRNRIFFTLDETIHQAQECNYDRAYHVVPFSFDEPLSKDVVERLINVLSNKLPDRAGYGASMARKLTVTHIVVDRPMNLFQHGIGKIHFNLLHGIGD